VTSGEESLTQALDGPGLSLPDAGSGLQMPPGDLGTGKSFLETQAENMTIAPTEPS
jgi:hypothetical protein